MKIYLLSYGKKKQNKQCKASELYIGVLFKKIKKYAEKYSDRYYILSAKYGLLDKDDMIISYNETLITKNKYEKIEWANSVYYKLVMRINKNDTIYILGGKDYYEHLEKKLINSGFNVNIPMRGLSIVRTFNWLNNNI